MGLELCLRAQVMVQRDFDGLAVKVAIEAEQMGFKQLLRLEHRAVAEVGYAIILAVIRKAYSDRVDAVRGPQIGAELHGTDRRRR